MLTLCFFLNIFLQCCYCVTVVLIFSHFSYIYCKTLTDYGQVLLLMLSKTAVLKKSSLMLVVCDNRLVWFAFNFFSTAVRGWASNCCGCVIFAVIRLNITLRLCMIPHYLTRPWVCWEKSHIALDKLCALGKF